MAVFGVLLGPCILVGAIGSGWWDIAAAFLAGAWVGMAMWLWDSPPEHIERLRRGAEGERKTARELEPLSRDSWSVVHDIDARFGNWDHVVVGSGGVFLLDSKYLLGNASIERGCLVVRREEDPDESARFDRLADRMRAAAAAVSEALRDDRRRPWVTPVVVVWPQLAVAATAAEGVASVSGRHLSQWLHEQEPRLDRARCLTLVATLSAVADRAAQSPGPWSRASAATSRNR